MKYRNLLRVLSLGLAFAATAATADDTDMPVVVELFTSQGCSSCPPADALLHELAKRDDVIALALHVDYWDYIGWKDQFALAGHTKRQKSYARVSGRRMIYTPQMIINGTDHVVGTHPMDVSELIALHDKRPSPLSVSLASSQNRVTITARAVGQVAGKIDVVLVRYKRKAVVDIQRGENAGKKLTYTNIVQSWQNLGQWDGKGAFETTLRDLSPGVVLFQKADYGPILAAQQIAD